MRFLRALPLAFYRSILPMFLMLFSSLMPMKTRTDERCLKALRVVGVPFAFDCVYSPPFYLNVLSSSKHNKCIVFCWWLQNSNLLKQSVTFMLNIPNALVYLVWAMLFLFLSSFSHMLVFYFLWCLVYQRLDHFYQVVYG